MPPKSESNNVDKSPFFAPSTPKVIISTPGGTKRSVKRSSTVKESKSTVGGATFNLINAIVGSGIVGIPYAVQQSGLLAGIFLICLCAALTDKSLRLLVETAKHSGNPTYETTMEAAYGTAFGFRFVTINMFIMSYGAMVSYLMIVKDTLPYVFGVVDIQSRRALLFLISITIMVPLSSQRDMANLSKTSRISVLCDIIMVGIVAYLSPIKQTMEDNMYYSVEGGKMDWPLLYKEVLAIRWDTIFVGLGVLSFAFVCQHSGFIIAGSLERPTNKRWGKVTGKALWVCAGLANLCGITGYLGFLDNTRGNILRNLPESDCTLATIARGMLGITMLFVYPMESFVTRHVAVVTLFAGRRAHEGEDAQILQRNDRRILLTVGLYIMALIPAAVFDNLGNILSITGAIGGSSLCYIGPGLVYLGIHGKDFIRIVDEYFSTTDEEGQKHQKSISSSILYYALGIPLWYHIAQIGSKNFASFQREAALKSPHISRLSSMDNNNDNKGKLNIVRSSSHDPLLKKQHGSSPDFVNSSNDNNTAISYGSTAGTAARLIIPPSSFSTKPKMLVPPVALSTSSAFNNNKDSPQGKKTGDDQDENITPQLIDFVVAIGFMLLGIVALVAGLASIS